MRNMLVIIIFLLLTFSGPLYILFSGQIDLHANYQTASRSSTHQAPDPEKFTDSIVQVYAARAFNWRGIFGIHTWIAVKPKNASSYTIYQVVGWRNYRGLPSYVESKDIPDRMWFNHKPTLLVDIRGQEADKLIPLIKQAADSYPFPTKYVMWPGPNSNTFIAYIARSIPQLKLTLPPTAIGKDFLPDLQFFAPTPSGTGYQFSLFGLLGVAVGREEGLEINFMSLIYGVNPLKLSIKLPGFGEIRLGSLFDKRLS